MIDSLDVGRHNLTQLRDESVAIDMTALLLLVLLSFTFMYAVRTLRTGFFNRHGKSGIISGSSNKSTNRSKRFASSLDSKSGYEVGSQPLEIPLTDKREYSVVNLKNHLRCVVVSDKDSEKSAAALVVRTGASNDPHDFPGLAHFTEHMLFLGSEKYPMENSYKEYLSKHGGSSNGATGMYLCTVACIIYLPIYLPTYLPIYLPPSPQDTIAYYQHPHVIYTQTSIILKMTCPVPLPTQ